MSLPYAPSRAQQSTMTTSLPILPQRQPSLRQPESVPAVQRPKLSLNTHQLRTFGKSSTSLRLDTLSAVSPTVRNTFTNAYEAPSSAAPTPGRPAKPRLSIDSSLSNPQASSNPSSSTPNSASTLSSAVTSATSTESATISIPYKQPHNLSSILSNSPARHLLPRKMAPVRCFFPAEKKVSFRTPLEEEIKTTKYTMTHYDMESSISSLETISSIETTESTESQNSAASLSIASTASLSPNAPSSPSEQSTSPAPSIESSPRIGGARTGEKRDSSESDSDSCPETPVAGRRKRRREWKWTLGSLDKSSTSEATNSDDDSN